MDWPKRIYFYFTDSFRVGRSFTVNYGLRWEPYAPLTDLNDREVQFRADAYLKGERSTRYLNAPKGLFYPGDTVDGETIPKGGVSSSRKQFAPRIGFAWDVTGDGKTSLRAGWGVYYDTPMLYMLNNMNLQAPFSFSVAFNDGLFDDQYRTIARRLQDSAARRTHEARGHSHCSLSRCRALWTQVLLDDRDHSRGHVLSRVSGDHGRGRWPRLVPAGHSRHER